LRALTVKQIRDVALCLPGMDPVEAFIAGAVFAGMENVRDAILSVIEVDLSEANQKVAEANEGIADFDTYVTGVNEYYDKAISGLKRARDEELYRLAKEAIKLDQVAEELRAKQAELQDLRRIFLLPEQ